MQLAHRPYGPGASPEEREAIASRVSVVGDRVLLLHEISVQTPFSVDLMCDRFEALARDWDRFAYVLDLTEAERPTAEARATLKNRVSHFSSRVALMAAVVGNNLLMRAMVRLVAYGMGLKHVSLHANRVEAIEEARRALGR